jgi:tetratricopeptide (TPR) repeat protein
MGTEDFKAAISQLDASDPESPEALNAKLDYADFLAGAPGDCQQRLNDAQSQLDAVTDSAVATVVLPVGRARMANLEYRIHAERAFCGNEPSLRQQELRAALDAARHAVDLYRDALDYQSMAVMQFNVGVTYRMLGEEATAVSALETAIAMDREYGFREDAQDNYNLLLRWKGDAIGPDPEAAPIRDSPRRPAALAFGWSAGDTDIVLEGDVASVVGDQIVRGNVTETLKRHVREDHRDWVVSYSGESAAYDFGHWPDNSQQQQLMTTLLLKSALPPFPGVAVTRKGDFDDIVDPKMLAASLSGAEAARIAVSGPASERARDLPASVIQAIELPFTAVGIEAKVAQDYYLGTATWIGAKPDQAVWYEMSAQLLLPGTLFVVTYDIEYAYTRSVRCTATPADRSCVEIVLHATPEADDVQTAQKEIARALTLPDGQSVHYWTATDLRIVTDPNVLMSNVCDMRRYWYIAINGAGKRDPIVQSERIVSTAIVR